MTNLYGEGGRDPQKSKIQQSALLPNIEPISGTLIGPSTHPLSFDSVATLSSNSQIFELKTPERRSPSIHTCCGPLPIRGVDRGQGRGDGPKDPGSPSSRLLGEISKGIYVDMSGKEGYEGGIEKRQNSEESHF